MALGGVHVGEHDVDLGFGPVGYPQLLSGEDPLPVLPLGAGRQREGVGAGSGFRKCIGAERAGGEPRQELLLEILAAPRIDGHVDQRVVHVEQHGRAGVHRCDLLHGQRAHEERPAGAPVLLRHVDAHQAQLGELRDECPVVFGSAVHFGYVRANLRVREIAHRLPEHLLVFR